MCVCKHLLNDVFSRQIIHSIVDFCHIHIYAYVRNDNLRVNVRHVTINVPIFTRYDRTSCNLTNFWCKNAVMQVSEITQHKNMYIYIYFFSNLWVVWCTSKTHAHTHKSRQPNAEWKLKLHWHKNMRKYQHRIHN